MFVVWRDKICILSIVFLFYYSLCESTPASPHMHLHHRSDERAEDGGFNPAGHNHIVDGQHHSEFDHEAILGSVKDAEEFDHLEPEEAKRRLLILLIKMDLNKDGSIERNELHAWILQSFKMLSSEESHDRFDDSDENGDGYVTWEEYIADTYGINNASEEGNQLQEENNVEAGVPIVLPTRHILASGATSQLMDEDKLMFETADLNKDGVLNDTEFIMFSHPEEHPEMLPIILKQTLKDKDKDSDGFIDFQEFVGNRAHHHDKEWLLVEKEKFDNEFDKDMDGKLNPAEILSWIVPSNDEIAEEEVDHLFAASDDDHDDLLSFNEVLDHQDIFVGSEATDYGDHLHNIHIFQDEL